MGLLLITSVAFSASDITYQGTSTQVISRTSTNKPMMKGSTTKSITLLKVKLSDKVKKTIEHNALQVATVIPDEKTISNSKTLPSSTQLGMNNVPVLDQGIHGTCATFAMIAAFDALRGEGDYYSELCPLKLGQHLAGSGYSLSGWDGQSLRALLARVDEFGLVSKQDQRAHGCAGMMEYPVMKQDNMLPMTLEDFHSISSPGYYSGLSEWSTLFDITNWLSKDLPSQQILEQTKTSLYYGNRVLVGVLLPLMDNVGALGAYHVKNDSWVLTGSIEQAIKLFLMELIGNFGGHAMVITGYDDDAIAVDSDGHEHKGLFTLRNSWGTDAGDQGNYYMSYDYFSVLVIELEQLIKVDLG
jgi:hypothetical protein